MRQRTLYAYNNTTWKRNRLTTFPACIFPGAVSALMRDAFPDAVSALMRDAFPDAVSALMRDAFPDAVSAFMRDAS